MIDTEGRLEKRGGEEETKDTGKFEKRDMTTRTRMRTLIWCVN